MIKKHVIQAETMYHKFWMFMERLSVLWLPVNVLIYTENLNLF